MRALHSHAHYIRIRLRAFKLTDAPLSTVPTLSELLLTVLPGINEYRIIYNIVVFNYIIITEHISTVKYSVTKVGGIVLYSVHSAQCTYYVDTHYESFLSETNLCQYSRNSKRYNLFYECVF